MDRKSQPTSCHPSSQSGLSLIETVIAIAILFVATGGLMSMAVVAMQTTENQGHLAARTTEYAQDKLEQLIALSYNDGGSPPCSLTNGTNTTVFPTTLTGGTGLCAEGSSDPDAPANGFVDYLDVNGNLLGGGATAPANWYYIRVWEISTAGLTANLKQITVTSKVRYGVGSRGIGKLAESTVTTLRSNPF